MRSLEIYCETPLVSILLNISLFIFHQYTQEGLKALHPIHMELIAFIYLIHGVVKDLYWRGYLYRNPPLFFAFVVMFSFQDCKNQDPCHTKPFLILIHWLLSFTLFYWFYVNCCAVSSLYDCSWLVDLAYYQITKFWS